MRLYLSGYLEDRNRLMANEIDLHFASCVNYLVFYFNKHSSKKSGYKSYISENKQFDVQDTHSFEPEVYSSMLVLLLLKSDFSNELFSLNLLSFLNSQHDNGIFCYFQKHRSIFPSDVDCTGIGASILLDYGLIDRKLGAQVAEKILANTNDGGVITVYFDCEKSDQRYGRVDPIACINALQLVSRVQMQDLSSDTRREQAYKAVISTKKYIVDHLNGEKHETRYYHEPDSFFFFLGLLYQQCPEFFENHLVELIKNKLSKIKVSRKPLYFSMRIITNALFGIKNDAHCIAEIFAIIRKHGLPLKMEALGKLGRSQIFVSSPVFSNAFFLKAINVCCKQLQSTHFRVHQTTQRKLKSLSLHATSENILTAAFRRTKNMRNTKNSSHIKNARKRITTIYWGYSHSSFLGNHFFPYIYFSAIPFIATSRVSACFLSPPNDKISLRSIRPPWPSLPKRPLVQAKKIHTAVEAELSSYGLLTFGIDQQPSSENSDTKSHKLRRTFQATVSFCDFTFPQASETQAVLINCLCQWMWLIDDKLDATSHQSVSNCSRQFLERLAMVCLEEDSIKPTTEFEKFTLRFLSNIKDLSCNKEWFFRFKRNVVEYLSKGVLVSLEKQRQGSTIDLSSYMNFRYYDSGVYPILDLIEFSGNLYLTEVECNLLSELKKTANRIIFFSNDLFSYHKEKNEDNTINIIKILLQQNMKLDEKAIAIKVIKMIESEIRLFSKFAKHLIREPSVSDALRTYITGVETCVKNHYYWSIQCRRYRGEHSFLKELSEPLPQKSELRNQSHILTPTIWGGRKISGYHELLPLKLRCQQ